MDVVSEDDDCAATNNEDHCNAELSRTCNPTSLHTEVEDREQLTETRKEGINSHYELLSFKHPSTNAEIGTRGTSASHMCLTHAAEPITPQFAACNSLKHEAIRHHIGSCSGEDLPKNDYESNVAANANHESKLYQSSRPCVDAYTNKLYKSKLQLTADISAALQRVQSAAQNKHEFVSTEATKMSQVLNNVNVRIVDDLERLRESTRTATQYLQTCSSILEQTAPHEVCRSVGKLRQLVSELCSQPEGEVECANRNLHVDIKAASDLLDAHRSVNVIGTVKITHMKNYTREYSTTPMVMHDIPSKYPVRGVAVLDHRVYVVFSDQPTVSIFASCTLEYLASAPVHDLVNPGDAVACVANRRLLVTDSTANVVHVINISTSSPRRLIKDRDNSNKNTSGIVAAQVGKMSKWRVPGSPTGLSIIKTGPPNVVVCFPTDYKIRVYTQAGYRLWEVSTEDIGAKVTHAICSRWCTGESQFPLATIVADNPEFIVCHGFHGDAERRVCLISGGDRDNASIRNFYDGKEETLSKEMYWPTHLATDENGCVFVVDSGNDRVQLMTPTLEHVKYVVGNGIDFPSHICFDEINDCLYIGRQNGFTVCRIRRGREIVGPLRM